MMPELCLDIPKIDKYLSKYVIKPLWDANYLQLSKIRFDMEPPKIRGDDYVFD